MRRPAESRCRWAGRRVAHERGRVDDVAARDDAAEAARRLRSMEETSADDDDGARIARGEGDGREHRVHAAVRGGGGERDRGQQEREARERAERVSGAARGPSRRGRARAHRAPDVFLLESTGGRVESDSCDARHSKTAGDAEATCSRDLFAARDADVDAAGQPALDALLPGEREGKKGMEAKEVLNEAFP